MPKRIGKYEISEEIGRGGFSRVYRGFDPTLDRPVAIKVSTRETDFEHLSRFRNEASSAGNLRHQNLVSVFDFGDDDGVPYLVMELLDGRDLLRIMQEGPKLSLIEKMQIMSQVAAGLSCAHENGVVHRDVKPANVMVLNSGVVKILDFGIARMSGEVSRLTQNGYLVGTPLYMSPEQLSGGGADGLSDIWAYGVLYFELLTGQHPFLSQDNTRLMRNIAIVNPPSVHSLARGIPEELAQVMRRALTKDRRRRYQSLDELLVDTNPILNLLLKEQTSELVTEAESYQSNGQWSAAKQTSERVLAVDPQNSGAHEVLKSLEQEVRPQPVAPAPVLTPIVVPSTPAAAAVVAEPVIAETPEFAEIVEKAPVAVPGIVEAANPAILARASAAAAAIAAAVASAKARQAAEQKTTVEEVQTAAAPVFAAPGFVEPDFVKEEEFAFASAPLPAPLVNMPAEAAPRVGAMAPRPQSVQTSNGPVFVTGEPLVVKKPAAAVITSRINEEEASVAVAAPPAPSGATSITKLPSSRPIPRVSGRNGSHDKPPALGPAKSKSAAPPDTLPMRRPPSEVYSHRRRRRSTSPSSSTHSIFTSNPKKAGSFPWAVVLFVFATAVGAAAVFWFSWSAPKYVTGPVLSPAMLTFAWRADNKSIPSHKLGIHGGTKTSIFNAASDQDWLIVTPVSDDPTNRDWTVTIQPEKLAPSTYTGWIDISSNEGFKTEAEVTLKITAVEAPALPVAPGANSAPEKKGVAATEPASSAPASSGNSAVAAKAPAAKRPIPGKKAPVEEPVSVDN